ncbi:MAG TPA: hypothetical protein VG122_13630 [Gemmata sp.]|nr:hypothetical protein [Gemmata sp.]
MAAKTPKAKVRKQDGKASRLEGILRQLGTVLAILRDLREIAEKEDCVHLRNLEDSSDLIRDVFCNMALEYVEVGGWSTFRGG